MHLLTDGCRKRLVGNPLLSCLLSEADGVNDALHLVQLLHRDVHLLSCHILVVVLAQVFVRPSDGETIFDGILLAKVVNEITLAETDVAQTVLLGLVLVLGFLALRFRILLGGLDGHLRVVLDGLWLLLFHFPIQNLKLIIT